MTNPVTLADFEEKISNIKTWMEEQVKQQLEYYHSIGNYTKDESLSDRYAAINPATPAGLKQQCLGAVYGLERLRDNQLAGGFGDAQKTKGLIKVYQRAVNILDDYLDEFGYQEYSPDQIGF